MSDLNASKLSLIVCSVLLFVCIRLGVAADQRSLTLATTTSVQDTGLLDVLLPMFTKQTGINIKPIAVGTGQALELARRGDADVLMVHARKAEDQFIAEGFGIDRRDVMYNYFVLVGPANDPANVRTVKSPAQAFAKIAQANATFVSRGDNSGTHKKEQELWKDAAISPRGDWYVSAGSGMAETLRVADEKDAYTLSDKATFLSQKKNLRLKILLENDNAFLNQYSVIAVNPTKFSHVNYDGATKFIRFLLSPRTQKVIANFGKDKFGEPLFFTYDKRRRISW